MHYENHLFWERCKWKYTKYFTDPSKVIEFGSEYINGTIRAYFRCKDYIGVDWRGSFCVDDRQLAHNVNYAPESFDTVVSASMFEHDPYWKKSIVKMVDVMKKDGLLAISWGAARNGPHGKVFASDVEFHALKAEMMLKELYDLGIYTHEFQYERSIMPDRIKKLRPMPIGLGEVVIVGFKDRKYATGEKLIDPLIDEDRI